MNDLSESGGKAPNGITYSSQDIAGETLAGKKQNFFVRLKKNKKAGSLKLNWKIVALCAVGVAVVAGATILIVIILNSNSPSTDDDPQTETLGDYDDTRSQDEILTELENLQPDSQENAEKIIYGIDDLFGAIDEEGGALAYAKDVYKSKIDQAKDTAISFTLKIEYAKTLINEKETTEALEILNSVPEPELSLEQKVDLYAAYRYLYEVAGDKASLDKYDAMLNKVMEELPEDVINAETIDGEEVDNG